MMSRDARKKRICRLLRLGAALSLLLLSAVLWRFSLGYAALIQISGDTVHYCSAEALYASDYEWMVRKEDRAVEPREFTLWQQTGAQTLENPLTGRQAKAPVLRFIGDVQLLLPGCWPLESGDANGCVLGRATALDLFGDEHAQGAELIFQGESYTVRAVENTPSSLLLLPASAVDPLNRIQMRGKSDAEAFALRHNLTAAPVQISYFQNLSNFICHIPELCFLGIAFYWLCKACKSQIPHPFRHTILLILCFALFTGSALYAMRWIPQDYLPSRWSDFEHFAELGRQLKEQSLSFFNMEKTLPDLQIFGLFLGACTGLPAAVLLLIAHAWLWALLKPPALSDWEADADGEGLSLRG